MRAGRRFGIAAFAAGLALGPAPVLAQAAPDSATNTPATETIGPRELQNFSLKGTVTRQADTPPPEATPRREPPPEARAPVSVAAAAASTRPVRREGAASAAAPAASRPTGIQPALEFPPPTPATSPLAASLAQPGFALAPDATAVPVAPDQKLPLWPWLLLAAVIGIGGVLLWRRRPREAFAGAPEVHAYVAPEAAPAPRPAPAPPREAGPAKPVGIVSSRLRPWIDIAFAPLGCTVDEERVTVEFEIQLTNSGGAPARDILLEASMFNAGASQEQDIGAFFANPVGQGERIQSLPPLQSVTIRTALVAPRANIQIFELGGRQVFVPLVAFNALYRMNSGSGQTSAAYLLGRNTKGEKLAPLRADQGPRAFTSLGIRPLPIEVRT